MNMFYYHIKRHRYSIVAGVPIVVLVATSLSLMERPHTMRLAPEGQRYVTVGEEVKLDLVLESTQPVNVVGATVHVPSAQMKLQSLSTEDSIVDIWSEGPKVDGDTVSFSGGIVEKDGFTGTGTVITLITTPHTEGEAVFQLENATVLAHDGVGSAIAHSKHSLTLWVRAPEKPSPDVNSDSKVNLLDVGIISSHLYFRYKDEYDLNDDGAIDFADLFILFSNFSRGSTLEGLVSSILF